LDGTSRLESACLAAIRPTPEVKSIEFIFANHPRISSYAKHEAVEDMTASAEPSRWRGRRLLPNLAPAKRGVGPPEMPPLRQEKCSLFHSYIAWTSIDESQYWTMRDQSWPWHRNNQPVANAPQKNAQDEAN
jgi:hypothetical protein